MSKKSNTASTANRFVSLADVLTETQRVMQDNHTSAQALARQLGTNDSSPWDFGDDPLADVPAQPTLANQVHAIRIKAYEIHSLLGRIHAVLGTTDPGVRKAPSTSTSGPFETGGGRGHAADMI
jgi:hypothetical protein